MAENQAQFQVDRSRGDGAQLGSIAAVVDPLAIG